LICSRNEDNKKFGRETRVSRTRSEELERCVQEEQQFDFVPDE
jgi:hypothetical protein